MDLLIAISNCFLFVFDKCIVYVQNIQKMLGLAPSRAATKQAGGFLGPPPQAAKFSWSSPVTSLGERSLMFSWSTWPEDLEGALLICLNIRNGRFSSFAKFRACELNTWCVQKGQLFPLLKSFFFCSLDLVLFNPCTCMCIIYKENYDFNSNYLFTVVSFWIWIP